MSKIPVEQLASLEFKEVSIRIGSPPAIDRLDSHLVGRFSFLSRNYIQRMIREGVVRVNGKATRPSKRVQKGDRIDLRVPVVPERVIEPEPIDLEVLWEDEDILVINKPPDLTCHAGRRMHGGTLANAIIYHVYGEEEDAGRNNPGLVHRLDKNTSGVLVIAKNPKAHKHLGRQFAIGHVDKEYLGVVKGHPVRNRGVIDAPIGFHPRLRNVMSARYDSVQPRAAVTHYEVVEKFRHGTLIRLLPETGRTHQLRVHLEFIGHPLFGEDRYRGRYSRDSFDQCIGRQALHAAKLSLSHPLTEEEMTFEAEFPADMRRLISLLREHTPARMVEPAQAPRQPLMR